jgi:hypothetical protein
VRTAALRAAARGPQARLGGSSGAATWHPSQSPRDRWYVASEMMDSRRLPRVCGWAPLGRCLGVQRVGLLPRILWPTRYCPPCPEAPRPLLGQCLRPADNVCCMRGERSGACARASPYARARAAGPSRGPLLCVSLVTGLPSVTTIDLTGVAQSLDSTCVSVACVDVTRVDSTSRFGACIGCGPARVALRPVSLWPVSI